MRTILQWLSPSGNRARLSILIFHRVLAQPDPLFPHEVHAARFDRLCGWLARDYNTLPLDEAVRRLREGKLPARALCITFDDGYADNLSIATPILKQHGLPATFFVATGFLDGGRMWNDTVVEAIRATRHGELDLEELQLSGVARVSCEGVEARRAAIGKLLDAAKYLAPDKRLAAVDRLAVLAGGRLPSDLMMTSAQVAQLHRAGMAIGGHTENHPILAVLDDQVARREIQAGRDALQAIIQAPVTTFAYPNGKPGEDYSPGNVQLVRELGFELAVSTAWGAATRSTSPFELPRFTPWDLQRSRFNLRMAANLLRR